MKSLISLLFILAICIGACQSPEKKKETEVENSATASKPNVLFILVDDLGWNDIGCYGNDFNETPNIDKMAAGGVRFTDAYASCPVCSPSRASILTGKSPASLKITDWLPGRQFTRDLKRIQRDDELYWGPDIKNELPHEETTLAETFKTEGYKTISIGKWHLGSEAFFPEYHGFDVALAGSERGSPYHYYYPYARTSRGGDSLYIPYVSKGGQSGEYLTDRLTNEAVKQIEAAGDSAFFMYLAYYSVHIPLIPREDLLAKYQAKLKEVDGAKGNPYYAAMVSCMDENVGKLLGALEKTGKLENTMVVFTSDNGGLSVEEGPHTPATDLHPLRDGKGFLHEGGIRVPLIVYWKGKLQTLTSDFLVSGEDYFPTLCEAIGINMPAQDLEGKSFFNVLQGEEGTPKDLFWHYPHYSNQGGTPGGVVRSGNYKLIKSYIGEPLELYDLSQDLGETNNLAESQPEKRDELLAKLDQWLTSVDADMPILKTEATHITETIRWE